MEKISFKRRLELKKQFKINYPKAIKEYSKLSSNERIKLLNEEFYLDKAFFNVDNKKVKKQYLGSKNIEYRYATTYHSLNHQLRARVKDNLYCTIATLLIEDCSEDERVTLLSLSTGYDKEMVDDVVKIVKERLDNASSVIKNKELIK